MILKVLRESLQSITFIMMPSEGSRVGVAALRTSRAEALESQTG